MPEQIFFKLDPIHKLAFALQCIGFQLLVPCQLLAIPQKNRQNISPIFGSIVFLPNLVIGTQMVLLCCVSVFGLLLREVAQEEDLDNFLNRHKRKT